MMRRKRAIIGCVVIALVCAVVFAVDPTHAAWMPKCAFHAFTGWQCPGCGFTRALHALLHGHPLQALSYNYFFIISIPLAIGVAFTTWSDSQLASKLRPIVQSRPVILGYVVLFFAWWIARNLLQC